MRHDGNYLFTVFAIYLQEMHNLIFLRNQDDNIFMPLLRSWFQFQNDTTLTLRGQRSSVYAVSRVAHQFKNCNQNLNLRKLKF